MRSMMRPLLIAVAVMALACTSAFGQTTFNLNFDGSLEVPGPGDPDGFGSGTLTIDPNHAGSPIYGAISWNFTYGNLDPLTAMHIHGPGGQAGAGAGIFINMGIATTGGANTLIQSYTDSNWPGTYSMAQLNQILASPDEFYVNIHTTQFGPGAIRGQLPEPVTLSVFAIGSLALLRRHRRPV